jgi:hypothetical protein
VATTVNRPPGFLPVSLHRRHTLEGVHDLNAVIVVLKYSATAIDNHHSSVSGWRFEGFEVPSARKSFTATNALSLFRPRPQPGHSQIPSAFLQRWDNRLVPKCPSFGKAPVSNLGPPMQPNSRENALFPKSFLRRRITYLDIDSWYYHRQIPLRKVILAIRNFQNGYEGLHLAVILSHRIEC